MDFLLAILIEVTATPIPVPDDTYNSPGLIGFIVTFSVAGIAVALIFDMNRRVRATRYRTEIRARLAAEELGNIEITKPDRPEPPMKPQRSNPEEDPAQ